MAKGPWRCNSPTGIPLAWCDYVEGDTAECLEDLIDRPDGLVFYRCNTAALIVSGQPPSSTPNTSRHVRRMFVSPAYGGKPVYRVTDEGRRLIGFLDCPSSLHAWGLTERAERAANQRAGKQLPTDPRSG